MGFLDKAKAAAEQAAAKAKEGVEDVQAKRELSQSYNELGKSTYELIESGEISNPQLAPLAQKVRELKEKLAGDDLVGAGVGTVDESPADSGPPAMPS